MTDLSPPPISAKQQSFTGLPGWLIVLGALTAVGSLSIDMYLPSFPAIVTALNTDAGAVQRTLSMFLVGFGFGQLVYGPLSDRFGRRPPLLFGMALYTVASLACMFATNIWILQWSRLLQALGGCAGIIIPRAAIRDRCDAHSAARALSLVMLIMGAAPILAPQLGSWILIWFSWREIFGVLMLFGAICLFAIGFAMEETVDRSTAVPINFNSIFRNYHELLRDRQFLTYSLCVSCGSAGMFAYIAGSPFVLMRLYGISSHLYGWIFGINAVGLIAGSQINARLLAYYSPRQILGRAVYFPFAAGAILLVLTLCHVGGLAILLPALFLAVGSLGLMTPNSTALALQHQGARAGTATALLGMLQFGLGTLSSSAISVWQTDSELPLATVITVCGLGALLMYRLAPRS